MFRSVLGLAALISCVCVSYGFTLLNAGGYVPVVVNKATNKSYYLADNVVANFYQASQLCKDIGMRLVSIPDKDVQEFLFQTVNSANTKTRYWSSGTNLVDGKNWVWLSAVKPVVYTDWLPGQPDSAAEHCIELQLQKNKGLQWNNYNCDVQQNFICESPDVDEDGKVVANNWLGAFADPTISPNFPVFNYNKNSYYIGNQVALSYLDASRFCEYIGMELVSIESNEENMYLHKYLRDTVAGTSFWSGGSRLIDGMNWYWLPSGRKVTYTKWLPNEPGSKTEHCIQLQFQRDQGLFWNDLPCTNAQNFICEAPTSKIAQCPVQDHQCNGQNEHCGKPTKQTKYHLVKEQVSYNSAVKQCQDIGMELLSIQNKAKQIAVDKFITESSYTSWIWTSGNRIADQKTWRWLSGEPISEFFWYEGEPNNQKGNEECISIGKKTGGSAWNDAPCDAKNYYICEAEEIVNNNDNNSNCGCQTPAINVYIDTNKQKEVNVLN
ncbi:unnamed protein product [Phyllotreta striolata]|uniref:C-type lectin domain-containing protein n=1 Tax=Phyllotreta striolata TaxID=444603 RepID=A0A9N9TPJ3_PHYSR|nr:unnamed protein product [Phyllotreta striolata]